MGGIIYYLVKIKGNFSEKINILDGNVASSKDDNINNNIDKNSEINNEIANDKEENIQTNIEKNEKLEISFKNEIFEKTSTNGNINIKNERNLPIISNCKNEKVSENISDYLINISDKDWNNLNNETERLINEIFDDSYTTKMNIGVSYLLFSNNITDSYVSIMYRCMGNLGGVSWDDDSYYQFDSETGKILSFEDICLNSNSKQYFYRETIDYLKQNYNTNKFWKDEFNGNWEDIVKENMFNIGNWYLTDNEIGFTFGKYMLANGAVGIVNVKIDKQDVKMQLNEEYR